jgi:hypothetical protein
MGLPAPAIMPPFGTLRGEHGNHTHAPTVGLCAKLLVLRLVHSYTLHPTHLFNLNSAASVNASAASLGNFSRPEIVFSWDDGDPLCYDLYNAAALPAGNGQLLIFPSGTLHLCNSTNSPFTRTYGKNDNILGWRKAHLETVWLAICCLIHFLPTSHIPNTRPHRRSPRTLY